MVPWPLDRVRRLRTWLLVRAGLWRGEWRRGRVRIAAGVRLLPWAMPLGASRRSWRYGLYTPAGLRDDEAAPLLGAGMHDPHGVLRRGLALDPLLALGTRSEPCAPLAIVHGSADAVVAPRCAEELLAQALESLRRAGLEPSLTETTPDGDVVASTDYRAASGLVVRRVLIRGAGHAWTGGPGGHPYCEEGGMALTALCARFLRDAGLFESSPAPSP